MTSPLTFERADNADLINFAVGQPSPDLIPRDQVQALASQALTQAPDTAFNYGEPQGEPEFRAMLADFLRQQGQAATHPERLFLTAGTSQGLELICERFTQPGDVIFVEDRSYFLALQIFKDHGLNLVSIESDENGMRIDSLTAALDQHCPTLLYIIPSFGNPTGVCLSHDRQAAIAALSETFDFLVIADEAYQLLNFAQDRVPTFSNALPFDRVICLGTFSKVLAPGLRLGWIETSPSILARLLESGWINSGGAVNQLTSFMVKAWLETDALAAHLPKLRAQLSLRRDAMDTALKKHLDDTATWITPEGGYFFWISLTAPLNTLTHLVKAREHGVGYQPGDFASVGSGYAHCLRLSFAAYPTVAIERGIERLAASLAAAAPQRLGAPSK